ncbi:unnamed protein product [Caenorhabditis sp. 36 PRJEB53466]|nr:unnamed protein product [Caenorhabditis sp. 36 PRJEB53466]
MGNSLSCKKEKKKQTMHPTVKPKNTKIKKKTGRIVLEKNRKIYQKDKEIYCVIFDPESFSIHDLALVGQKNAPENLIRHDVLPKKFGRVELIPDISSLMTRKGGKTTPLKTKSMFGKSQIGTSSTGAVESNSNGEFEIVAIQDYVDDLYLQMLNGDRTIEEAPRDSSASSTDTK